MTAAPGRYGPNTAEVEAMLARAATLTPAEAARLDALDESAGRDDDWYASRDAARESGIEAGWHAARDEACSAAGWVAARAAIALVVRDLITAGQYAALAGPWESVTGPLGYVCEGCGGPIHQPDPAAYPDWPHADMPLWVHDRTTNILSCKRPGPIAPVFTYPDPAEATS